MLGMAAKFMPNIKKQNIEMYNFAPKFVEIYNTGKVDLFGQQLFDLSAQEGIGVTKGGMEVAVEGEDGRANINQVDSIQSKRALFQHLFGYLQGPRPAGVGLTDEDKARAELILNIIDWVDEDEVRTEIDQNGNFSPQVVRRMVSTPDTIMIARTRRWIPLMNSVLWRAWTMRHFANCGIRSPSTQQKS